VQVNPLAYWTFEDCFDYIAKYKIPIHPLHAQGYPSIGDAKDTVKVCAVFDMYTDAFQVTT
jgi:3'-phosphoadenosine 5'-phosphosulfate sulfotransferase (PAPS reductase)/FAD synthetase